MTPEEEFRRKAMKLRDAVVKFRRDAGRHLGQEHVTAEYRPCSLCEESYVQEEDLLDAALREFDRPPTLESESTEDCPAGEQNDEHECGPHLREHGDYAREPHGEVVYVKWLECSVCGEIFPA